MRTVAILGLAILLLFVGISNVQAAGQASIEVNVNYFANYGQGADVSDRIFVDNNEVGQGSVTIPLTEGGEFIVDNIDSNRDVPGLHIIRGVHEEFGEFIQIANWGNNSEDSRESIKFSIKFNNAVIDFPLNENGGRFDHAYDGICGIAEEDGNAQNDNPSNDEIETVSIQELEFCSVTSEAYDQIRIYYNYDKKAPNITNILTDPQLPIVNEGEEQDISVTFDSDEYPILVKFKLKDSHGITVLTSDEVQVNDASELPLIFTLPSGLDDDHYKLYLVAKDLSENSGEHFVGDIEVDAVECCSNGGGDDDDDRIRPKINSETRVFDSVKSYENKKSNKLVLEDDKITLGKQVEKKSNSDWLLAYLLVILVILILIAIIIVSMLK